MESPDFNSHLSQFSVVTWLATFFSTFLLGAESWLFSAGIDVRQTIWRFKLYMNRLKALVGLGESRRKQLESEDGSEVEDDRSSDEMGISMQSTSAAIKRHRRQVVDTGPSQGSNYPGMVNLSGTLCYMNSVLQAFASLPRLHDHLDAVIALAEDVDLPTPVTDNLLTTLEQLNTPSASAWPQPLRPLALVQALSTLPPVRRLLQTREHQDAHELFLLLASSVGDELSKLSNERRRDRGFAEVAGMSPPPGSLPGAQRLRLVSGASQSGLDVVHGGKGKEKERVLSPWEGLSANRRSCLKCGWCEAIRYETMGAMDVAVPMHGQMHLAQCLQYFTKIEMIDDAYCDSCTLQLTLAYYQSECIRLAQVEEGQALSTARKKRGREARKIEKILKAIWDDRSIAGMETRAGLEDVKWVKGRSRSGRQSMIARPPPILCLHLVRSEYTPYGQVVKKTSHIVFPIILDITEFTTSGSLHTQGDGPISRHTTAPPSPGWRTSNGKPPQQNGISTPDDAMPTRVLYRLEAAICHYGFTHSFGHFVAYRRKPAPGGYPRKSCPDYCSCQDCLHFGQVRSGGNILGRGWLRISDADVDEVGEEAVLNERASVVMLFYQRVEEYQAPAVMPNGTASLSPTSGDSNKALGTTGTIDALMEEMRLKGGGNGLRKAWSTESEEPVTNGHVASNL